MIKMACVVVLYNPSKEVIKKMKEYVRFFEVVVLVDNSIENDKEYFTEEPNIKYLPLHKNTGIANALNVGLDKTIQLGYKWVMTLDQDSIMTEECVQMLQEQLIKENYETTAILGANYEPEKCKTEAELESLDFIITSGSVMNTEIYRKEGPFIDDMFIDAVDYEYCYRLKSKGYNVKRLNSAMFTHKVGEPTYHNGVKCRNYPPLRYYFITRNNLMVSYMYKSSVPESKKLREHIHRYLRSARYEKNSYIKYLYMAIGYLDYVLWRTTGKYFCHIPLK